MRVLTSWLNRLLVAGLCLLSLPAFTEPLVVVGTPEPPFKMMRDGQVTGIDVQIIREVLARLGIEAEFRLSDSGSRMMREVRLGHVDVVMSLSFKPDRTEFLSYPEHSYKDVSWHFFIRHGDLGRIQYESLADLTRWRVGAVQSWSYTPEFWDAPLNRKVVTDHQLLIDMLLTGRIDVAPMNTVEAFQLIQQRNLGQQLVYLNNPLISRPYFNVFVNQSNHPNLPRLRAEYDRVIAELEASGFIDDLYRQYLGRDSQFQ
ncbi:substrate-binding periplasmic protein [Saccharospirillum salsuginis]|uniref:Glutamine transporter substrate-binding protein n=1 Tax=Saccharospirillum salsuginis TaxID=418750 RepID=A0A918KHQ7_9GAMM|nr:transporter substrate-binding domain-containing protein [Saccharospirillum salsuginis]GGX63033.1 glutamine transporter substrate-binding protein [Saccharospirillum salsuginis]